MKEKIKKIWKIILPFGIIVISVILYFLFVFDVGINSKYFVQRDFDNAFLYRKTGNCTAFKSYLLRDVEKWGERCIKENDRDYPPIENFLIKDISINRDSAFLQVELERNYRGSVETLELLKELEGLEKSYLVTYTLQRGTDQGKFLFLFPKTKWFINQELK